MRLFVAVCLLGMPITLAAQTTYTNPQYAISLKHPSEYVMTEGELGQKNIQLGYLGSIRMEFVAPGGVRVVTFEAPKGSYPGTDFVNAFLTLSVNRYLTGEECRQFPDWVPGAGPFLQ